MPDEVTTVIQTCRLPRTVRHHALIVYRLMRHRTGEKKCFSYPARTVACACLLYAVKERNRTSLAHSILDLRRQCDEADVVALELWLMEVIREKVILVEACLRVAYREFLDEGNNQHVLTSGSSSIGEELISLALVFIAKQYENDECLRPERGARVGILSAAAAFDTLSFTTPCSWPLLPAL